jgi:tRNA-2-methylthio-N6-dimethylallyladenosine synthase
MNRKHSSDDYRRTIDKMRQAQPAIALSSDFIVGFPGETDADFAATMQLVRDIGFAQAYSFSYSVRPGTPAAGMPNQIDDAVKEARLYELQNLLHQQQKQFNESFIGRTVSVLFDRRGKLPGQLLGRTPWLQSAHAELPEDMLGSIMDMRVIGASLNSLATTHA